jgi:hypothetical protein
VLTIAAVAGEIHSPLALGIAGQDGATGLEDRLVARTNNKSPMVGGVDSIGVTGDKLCVISRTECPEGAKGGGGLEKPNGAIHEKEFEFIDALNSPRGFSSRLHGGEQKRSEHRNDRDHDQQLDQRKSVPPHWMVLDDG